MVSKIRKRRVNLNLYNTEFDCKTYYGRLLGLVDDQEFAAMVNDPKLQNKCLTKGTKFLSDITDNWYDLTGYRLVLALKKVNGVDVQKRLLVTDKLGLVSFVRDTGSKDLSEVGISIADGNGSYIFMQEEHEEGEIA